MTHVYAFGSLCRGEFCSTSDIDLLAIAKGHDPRFDSQTFSIYSYSRIEELWKKGNPFAWHLHLEAKIIYSSNNEDFLKNLGPPSKYTNCLADCKRFFHLLEDSFASLENNTSTIIFDLSTAFLGIRNFASCFSLGMLKTPNFSRKSATQIANYSIDISKEAFDILERARILSTRGLGTCINEGEIFLVKGEIRKIKEWMNALLGEIKNHERLQQ